MGDVGIVKVLRQKCDDLEDQLDTAQEAKDAAIEAATELEVELVKMREQLEEEKEARLQVEEGSKGGGAKEAELQASLEQLRSSHEAESETLKKKVQDLNSELEESRKQLQTDKDKDKDTNSKNENEEIERLKKELDVAKASAAEGEKLRAEVEELRNQLATAKEQTNGHVEISSQLDAEKRRNDELQQSLDRLQAEQAGVESRLEEAVRLKTEAEAKAGEAQGSAAQAQAREEELRGECEALRQAAADDSSTADLQSRLAAAERQLEEHQTSHSQAVDQLRGEAADHQRRAQESEGGSEALRSQCDELSRLREAQERRIAELTSELEASQDVRAADAHRCAELQAGDAQWASQLQAGKELHSRVQEELGRVNEAFSAEKKRGQEVEVSFGHLQDQHQALFDKYSALAEEQDNLKGDNKRVTSEREQLKSSLEEECRLRKELEEAPPTQLSVSDVLISVSFEGVQSPLEIKPWDTDYAEVAQKWLTASQKSAHLLNSVVAYLKHLDDTATAFPVRVDAKLSDVHEQFGL